jgi:ribosomal protein S2
MKRLPAPCSWLTREGENAISEAESLYSGCGHRDTNCDPDEVNYVIPATTTRSAR